MSFLTGLSNAISSIPVPGKAKKFFQETSKEGVNAILPLEGSVLVGRSAAAAKRGGFMEFQERFLEELVVGIIWLFGVGFMRKLFDKSLLPRFIKGAEHLSPEIAWRKMGKSKTVELSAQELFTKNAGEVSKLMKVKGLRWLFSVGTIIFTVALAVPKLNQMKTDWIIRREEAKKAKATGAAPQAPAMQGFQQPQPGLSAGTSNQFQTLGQMPAGMPARPAFSSLNQPARNPGFDGQGSLIQPKRNPSFDGQGTPVQPAASMPMQGAPKFGLGGGLLQALGHAVEQTPYGSILVVDTGITGGRAVVAGQRSIFESVEIVFRDAVSLYFYIMFAPHMLKGIAKVVDPALGTTLRLEPKVIEALHNQMWKQANEMAKGNPALKAALTKGEMPLATLKEILLGTPSEVLGKSEGILRNQLRMAPLEAGKGPGFISLLEKETGAYLEKPEQATRMTAEIRQYLASHLSDKTRVAADDLQDLLRAIDSGHGGFAELAKQERANLGTAVKQAFRHTVGIPVELSESAIKGMEVFKDIFNSKTLSGQDKQALLERIQTMAKQDGLNQVATMYRRSLNLSRSAVGEAGGLIKRMEAQADLIEQASNRGIGLDDILRRELDDVKSLLNSTHWMDKLKLKKANLPETLAKELENLADATPAQLKELETRIQEVSGKNAAKALEKLKALNGMFAETPANQKAVAAIQEQVLTTLRELGTKAGSGASAEVKEVLQHYGKRIGELLGGKGQLFSLYLDGHDQAITDKLLELSKGGLQRDGQLIREALESVGHLTTDSRKYTDPGKATEMRALVSEYTEKLLQHAEKSAVKAETGGMKLLDGKGLLEKFYKLNRNSHILARTGALAATMLCLGWAVPKLQYALTKKLTGKDEHPGIAKAAGHDKAGDKQQPAGQAPESAMPSQLTRRNFQAFQRTV